MMISRCCIFTLALLLIANASFSREKQRPTPDSLATKSEKSERIQGNYIITDTICILNDNNIRLYDSIAAKSSRRAVPRLLYNTLFIKPKLDTTSSGQVFDESLLYAPYEGRTIGKVTIEREEVFNKDGNWFERTGNNMHMLTREQVIRRDLLFKSGDMVDPQLLVRNKQLLRSRAYISNAWVELLPDPDDSTYVDVIVRTRDSWTISANLDFGRDDRTLFALYDANILGSGNKLSVTTNFRWTDFTYGGNIIAYEIPNLLGTFYSANLSAGRDFYNSELKAGLKKEFILPTDYEVGVDYNDVKAKYYFVDRDTMDVMRVRSLNLWAGKSFYIPKIRSSIFFTGHYSYGHYPLRPDVSPDHNPAFHNYDRILFGLGLYREKFYSANMVYGFGTREYLATGYRAEITGGYAWEEFHEHMYLGTAAKAGNFTSLGYVMGRLALGSYVDLSNGAWRRSAIDIDMKWFSNLFIFRRNRIRQFLSLNFTQGWNRGTGSDEILRFTKKNGLRTITEDVTGINRLIMNTETVLFAPFQPLGFRFAFFGFADFGLLGNQTNLFNNEFCASFGVGVRIKNERLIFSTIQIQLGISVGKRGWLDSRYFRISSETRMEQYRYLPSRPEIVGFK